MAPSCVLNFTFKFACLISTADKFQSAIYLEAYSLHSNFSKPYSLHSILPKCMISCVVVFDDWVMGVVYDDAHRTSGYPDSA